MPSSKRTSSVLNDDHDDLPEEANLVTNPDDARAAAEEAEAEAAEAEAQAAAARARARAIRLRREAAAAKATAEAVAPTVEAPLVASPSVEAPVAATEVADEELDATELDESTEDYPDEPSRWSRRPRLSGRVLKVVAAALVIVASIALLGLSAVMYQQHRNAEAQRELSAEFTAAARQGAVTLMSMNFNTAKDDVQRIIDNTTGDFHENFKDEAQDFITVAQSAKAVIEASVTGVGIQKMTKDTATALVTVTTRVSNLASDKQDPRAWRLLVDLARDGGQVKLAKVEFVP